MQVFKAYFKILKSRIVGLMVYFGIFIALALMITNSLGEVNPAADFTETKSYIAFYNMDGDSELVDGLKGYLQNNTQFVDIPDDTQKIQDALFYGKVVYVLRVPKGFTESFMSGKDVALDKMTAAGSIDGVYMDAIVNKYLNAAALYIKNVPGITQAELVQNVGKDLAVHTDVTMNTYAKASDASSMSYYFQYFAYVILAVMIMGVTSFMMVFNENDLYKRNLCSPLKPSRMNMQIVLGNVLFGLLVWIVLCVVAFTINGKGTLNTGTILLCLNALTFTAAALAIGFLAGKFVKSNGVQAAVTNVISLGVCFLSGVFVEQELLGKTVLNISSFTPGYWYIKAINDIRGMVEYSAKNITPVIYSMLIQLGFAVALIAIALVVTKQKKVNRNA